MFKVFLNVIRVYRIALSENHNLKYLIYKRVKQSSGAGILFEWMMKPFMQQSVCNTKATQKP
jgi:hypothetical protein